MVKTYRKKPVVIEAIQWTGKNMKEIREFSDNKIFFQKSVVDNEVILVINTLEGQMRAEKDDWIIKGVKSEFYPCKPDIFEMTYEMIKDG
jgi:hypothetical protein